MTINDKLRGKDVQTKIKRYWPGKPPEWAHDADDKEVYIKIARAVSLENAFPTHQDELDSRLLRLAKCRTDDLEEVRADHTRMRLYNDVSIVKEENKRQKGSDSEEEDDVATEERREMIRKKGLERLITEDEDEEEEEEEEDEYESCSEDEREREEREATGKHGFVPKEERDTIAEKKRQEAKEKSFEESLKKRWDEIKLETKIKVVEEIKEEEIRKNMDSEACIADVDITDMDTDREEYEAWRVREVARIRKDREEREAKAREKEETERMASPKPVLRPKRKLGFLQKYYHSGVFFQSDNDDVIYQRDYSAPTGEDKLNKSILPKVMQVKRFGRSGRTKWTHLVNEDTTDWNNPWTYRRSTIGRLVE